MIGIPLTTVCYVMVNVAYLAVLSPIEMMESEAVAVVTIATFLFPLHVIEGRHQFEKNNNIHPSI